MSLPLSQLLAKHQPFFANIVPFAATTDRWVALDLSIGNSALTPAVYGDLSSFSNFIDAQLLAAQARFGFGGYMEQRDVYNASARFAERLDFGHRVEQRNLHLGVDIWGKAGTPVVAPWGGSVHSVAYNDGPGNYGGTIILQHQLSGFTFYSLYGHLRRADLRIAENQYVSIGEQFAQFGTPADNGGWPPHLHFQLIEDLQGMVGDYPGVGELSKREYYAENCPDPELMLGLMRYTAK